MAVLSRMAEIVRRHDPDRFFTALFAPAERREALFTLYAFNHELARAHEVAREPMMALIRLQWWREVVEGARRQHEVAEPLFQALRAGQLYPDDLLAMIAARELEAEPIETLAAWRDYVLASAGGVAVAAGHVLGGTAAMDRMLRSYGAAYGTSGLLRSASALAAQGRNLLPPGATVGAARTAAAEQGLAFMAAARQARPPRMLLPAILPAALVRGDLRDPARAQGARPPAARFAVLRAAILGRI